MSYAVRFEEVTKRYPRGGPRYPSLRHDLAAGARRLGQRLRGRRPPPEGTLALEDVSFEVQEGESFAIIGPNGAGKTTALKLISRISYPSGGRVRVRGRVAALIEVGSGVHPELTARENIMLYGQILGMSKSDVRRRFDEIVEFAELGHALDMPVKMYSSGMQLRLGFAIASHLDPDVFVVDEALAVGDAGFQAKCVERMSGLVSEGRALLFVSHNLSAVEAVCRGGLFLLDGRVVLGGSAREALGAYLDWIDEGGHGRKHVFSSLKGRGLSIDSVKVLDADQQERYAFATGDAVEIHLEVRAERTLKSPWFSIGISDGRPGALILCSMLESSQAFDLKPGHHVLACRLGPLPLGPRTYEIWASVREASGGADLVDWNPVGAIRIKHPEGLKGPAALTTPWMYGPVRVGHEWRLCE
jgi:lipopolysaccharide transport system ATP-binding protein